VARALDEAPGEGPGRGTLVRVETGIDVGYRLSGVRGGKDGSET